MSDTPNPYQPPVSPDEPVPAKGGVGLVTELTRQLLGKAGPWLGFLGVMAFIGCGFLAVIALGMIIVSLAGGDLFGSSAQARLTTPMLGLLYLALAIVSFFPARFISSMGSNARRYTNDGESSTLEAVVLNLTKAAKFYGVVTIVALAATVVGLVIVGIVAAVTAAGG